MKYLSIWPVVAMTIVVAACLVGCECVRADVIKNQLDAISSATR